MKTLKIIATITALLVMALYAKAQTNTAIVPFYDQAASWATSISYDPAVAWTNQVGANIEISTGARQVTGIGAKDYVIGQYDIGRFNLGGEVDFFGIGSTINGGELRTGYALAQIGDFKLEANLGAGYGQNNAGKYGWLFEPELAIHKKMTRNTFAELRISEPVYLHGAFSSTPTFKAGVGFTF